MVNYPPDKVSNTPIQETSAPIENVGGKDDELEKERLIQELEQKNAEEQHQLALEKYNLEV